MSISIVAPLDCAFNRTRRVLFQPFDFGKWFVIGFTAFLAMLGRGGGGGNAFQWRNHQQITGDQVRQAIERVITFVETHVLLIAIIVVCTVLLSAALTALLQWLSSRGMFMFLDNVVRNRAEVKLPWRQYAPHGNSLFALRFVVWIITSIIALAVLASGVMIAWPDIMAWTFGSPAVTALAVTLPALLVFGIAFLLFTSMLDDFVVPIMYRHNLRAWPALGVFVRQIVRGHFWLFVLFYLFYIVLGIAAFVLMVLVGLLTCCCGCCLMSLPYIGTVVTLPLWVFFRCYTVYFLGQFGPEWQLLPDETI